MSSFAERFGNLTVEQAIELNNKANLICEWGTTTQTEEN